MSSPAAHNYDDPAVPPRLCQNCGTRLRGPYCSNCGQHDVDFHRSFHHLTHDVLENLFHFDGKFLVSVAWLLAKPGRMTAEFNAGRRASQVPPLRFYIFVTVLFFIGVNLLNHGHLFAIDRREANKAQEVYQPPRTFTTAQKIRYGELFGEAMGKPEAKVNQALRTEIIAQVLREIPSPSAAEPKTTSPAAAPTEKKKIRERVGDTELTVDTRSSLGRAFKEKLESGEFTIGNFLDALEARVPTLLFLGMPVFALLLKLLYFRQGRYYIEHLIFSVHLHTWVFLVVMIGNGYFRLAALGPNWLTTAFPWLLTLWMAWYLFAAFRTVYGQGWFWTVLKIAVLGAGYFFVLCLLTGLVVVLTIASIVYLH